MKISSSLQKLLVSIAFSLLLIVSFAPPAHADTVAVTIIDPNPNKNNPELYNALHDAPYNLDPTHAGFIWASEMSSLTGVLDLNNKGIHNANGLQYCSNIETLYFSNNPISVLPTGMSNMVNLEYLTLNSTNLNDSSNLGEIKAIPNLRALSINYTGITDVSFLSSVTTLRELGWAYNNTPIDVSTLSGLTQLTFLNISSDTAVHGNIGALSTLTNLNTLNISNCEIRSLSAISGLHNLTWLVAQGNYISDLAPIDGKPISILSLQNNYLDPTPGSADRKILDTFTGTVDYGSQHSCTIRYEASPGADPTDSTVYYEQNVMLPAVAGIPANKRLLGWDTYENGTWDHTAGETIPFMWHTLPIPGDSVTYTAHYRDAYTDSTLTALASTQALSPAFSPSTHSYTVSLPKSVGSVTLTPTAATGAVFTIDDAAVASKEITVGNGQSKTVHIAVTAENTEYQSDYSITVTREALDANCLLTGIALSPASLSLSPTFSSAQADYTVALPLSVGSVTLTADKPALASVTIDGEAVTAKEYPVYYGETKTAAIVVTAENGSQNTYHVTLTRARPDASRLLYLGNTAGSLNVPFDSLKTNYTLTLPEGTKGVTLRPTKAVASSKLYINNKLTASRTFTLATGKSTKATVKVVSATGVKCTYTIMIKRSPSTNANLKSLSAGAALAPQFNAAVNEYTVKVPEGKSSVTVKAVKADANATVTINGKKTASRSIKVKNGQTVTVTVTVKAQAGNTKTYKLVLRRPPHINSLKASPIVAKYPTVQIAGKPVKFTYSLAAVGGSTRLEIFYGGAWATLLERSDSAGVKTFMWYGKIGESACAPGKYPVRLTVTGAGYSVSKTITVVVK